MIWIQFFISSAIIVFAGVRLTRYADILSDRLNIGKVWIGMILLGIVTSLPEAVTSLVAVISLKAGNLAVGNMLGSNNINLMFIVIMDFAYRKGSITNQIGFKRSVTIPAFFAAGLMSLVALDIFLSHSLASLSVGPLGISSFLIMIFYFLGVKISSGLERETVPKIEKFEAPANLYFKLVLSIVAIIVASVWLTYVADAIALVTGWGRTFVGTFFLALSTSLPELVVTLAALQINAIGLAVGNIFGSNMINMFIIALCDAVYRKGPILKSVSYVHILTAGLGLLLTGIVFLGLKKNRKKTFFRLGWDSLCMILVFLIGLCLLYSLK